MTLRYTLSRLERPDARRAFGRTWLWVCLAGAGVTLAADGGRDLFLVLVVWMVCVFAPVRIAAETLHTLGPRWKRSLQARLLARAERYTSPEDVALMVEWFAARGVRAPRLAPHDLAEKVTTAAVRLCTAALLRGEPGALRGTTTRCASLLDRWVGAVAAGEHQLAAAPADGAAPPELWDAGASIQDQWETLRALAGLAALTRVLVDVYDDSGGRPASGPAPDAGAAIRRQADAAMDYVDQIGLGLEGPAWEDVHGVPREALPLDAVSRAAETWRAFFAGPLPAPRRLGAFVDAIAA